MQGCHQKARPFYICCTLSLHSVNTTLWCKCSGELSTLKNCAIFLFLFSVTPLLRWIGWLILARERKNFFCNQHPVQRSCSKLWHPSTPISQEANDELRLIVSSCSSSQQVAVGAFFLFFRQKEVVLSSVHKPKGGSFEQRQPAVTLWMNMQFCALPREWHHTPCVLRSHPCQILICHNLER